MRLILTLAEGGSSLPDNDRKRILSSSGIRPTLTIGRNSDNDWVLPSPDRGISRTHCSIAFESGRFVLTDLSTNGLMVNQTRTERESRVILNEGDTLSLGNFVIEVTVLEDPLAAGPNADLGSDGLAGGGAAGRGPLDLDPLADMPARPDPSLQPMARMVTGRRGADPFETSNKPATAFDLDRDPFEDNFSGGGRPVPDWKGSPQADHASALSQAMIAPRMASARKIDFDALIGDVPGTTPRPTRDESFGAPQVPPPQSRAPGPSRTDPFGLDDDLTPIARAPAPAVPPAPRQARSFSLNDDLTPVAQPPPAVPAPQGSDPFSLDDAVPPTATPEPVALALQPSPQPKPREAPPEPPVTAPRQPATPLIDQTFNAPGNPFAEPPPVVRPRGTPAADGQSRGTAATSGTEPPPVPANGTSAPAKAESGSTEDARQALIAFLEGAGLPPGQIDTSDPAATLRAAGKIFRVMTEGFQQVLKSRAAVKSDMGIEQTIISSSGNNALKFAVTTDDAVRLLLTPKTPGYMDPLRSTRQAADDIVSHELGVMAGVQEALLSLLHRFNPDELEKRLEMGVLGGLLPAARKARYWDAFRQTYGDLSREAEDEFHNVFGRPFAKAYTTQARKD
jgi:type VI secretion system FHA domain protein